MKGQREKSWSRRDFLNALTVAGAGGLFGFRPEVLALDPPPEITKIRFDRGTSICSAPRFVAESLLRSEGFTDVQYIEKAQGIDAVKALGFGEVDFAITFVGNSLLQIDAGDPILLLAGLHIGCYELFGNDRIRSVRDLKGKRVAVSELKSGRHLFLASIAKYVGLDPQKDINWVTDPPAVGMRLFAEGKVDALMGFPPEPQELRTKKIGHVVVNTTLDRPWSQYFCCGIAASRDFVRKHPTATKRVLRAILKANQICALEPERAARLLIDKGYTTQYDYAVQTLKEIPYDKWREYDPEDTARFYSLRLHEAGLIKNNPQKILAQGTDWRFLKELKRELKG